MVFVKSASHPTWHEWFARKWGRLLPRVHFKANKARPGAHCGHGTCAKGAREVSSAKMRMISARTITEIIIENYSGIAPKRSGWQRVPPPVLKIAVKCMTVRSSWESLMNPCLVWTMSTKWKMNFSYGLVFHDWLFHGYTTKTRKYANITSSPTIHMYNSVGLRKIARKETSLRRRSCERFELNGRSACAFPKMPLTHPPTLPFRHDRKKTSPNLMPWRTFQQRNLCRKNLLTSTRSKIPRTC